MASEKKLKFPLMPNGTSVGRNTSNPMRYDHKKYAIPEVAINLGTRTNGKEGAVDKDLRQRVPGTSWKDHSVSGIITSFKKPNFTAISKIYRELRQVLSDKRAKRILAIIVFVIFSMSCFFKICADSKSMALTAYTYISLLDLSVLLTCLLSIWVEQQRPNTSFTFGYGRFEVLAVFCCTVSALIGAMVVFKEGLETLILQSQHAVDGSKILLGTGGVLLYRLIVIHCTDSKAWNHVFFASKSSWLQRHAAEFCENLCHLLPGLSRFLLPRLNPFVLMAHLGAIILSLAQCIMQFKGYYTADTISALFIAILVWITMFPMCMYAGLILLQTTPSHIMSQLDKCLREATTLDGVLEFRNEHFWTLSFGILAGSIHVRVRRDANEQLVLSHLTNQLSSLVPVLTIQVFKDDWTRSSATTLQLLNDSARVASFSTLTPPSSYQYRAAPPTGQVPVTNLNLWNENQARAVTGASTAVQPTLKSVPFSETYASGRPMAQSPAAEAKAQSSAAVK